MAYYTSPKLATRLMVAKRVAARQESAFSKHLMRIAGQQEPKNPATTCPSFPKKAPEPKPRKVVRFVSLSTGYIVTTRQPTAADTHDFLVSDQTSTTIRKTSVDLAKLSFVETTYLDVKRDDNELQWRARDDPCANPKAGFLARFAESEEGEIELDATYLEIQQSDPAPDPLTKWMEKEDDFVDGLTDGPVVFNNASILRFTEHPPQWNFLLAWQCRGMQDDVESWEKDFPEFLGFSKYDPQLILDAFYSDDGDSLSNSSSSCTTDYMTDDSSEPPMHDLKQMSFIPAPATSSHTTSSHTTRKKLRLLPTRHPVKNTKASELNACLRAGLSYRSS